MKRNPRDIAPFAETNHRGNRRLFGIRLADRRAHMHLVGKTGTGKTTLMESLLRHDAAAGGGFALIDLHGDLAASAAAFVRKRRPGELVYLDAADPACPVGVNPLARIAPRERPRAASALVEAFRIVWKDSWGPRLEHILRNLLYALLDMPGATLADGLRLLDDKAFRKRAMEYVRNPTVHRFWTQEYEGYPARLRGEAIAPLQNKLGAFLTHPALRRLLTSERPTAMRRVMDEGRCFVANLSRGTLGEDAAALLGALLIAQTLSAGLSRADTPPEERRDFFVYADEFHAIAGEGLAMMLSELRKYRIGMVLAHQHLGQLPLPVRDAVLGNACTLVCFRVGGADAALLARELAPEFSALDLISLPNYHIYLKLMIDGTVSRPFSAVTVPPDNLLT